MDENTYKEEILRLFKTTESDLCAGYVGMEKHFRTYAYIKLVNFIHSKKFNDDWKYSIIQNQSQMAQQTQSCQNMQSTEEYRTDKKKPVEKIEANKNFEMDDSANHGFCVAISSSDTEQKREIPEDTANSTLSTKKSTVELDAQSEQELNSNKN